MSLESIRLNKRIASSGFCSRRKADELIAAGSVCVNGVSVTDLGRKVTDSDQITINGQPLQGEQKFAYLLLHKPIQVVSTVSDPEGRTTVLDLLPEQMRKLRVYPVGRLDYFSEGLLLLTNDGELTYRLTHPKYEQEKVYEVLTREALQPQMIQVMRKGMRLSDGTKLAPVDVATQTDDSGFQLTLRQGLNRQIRRMCKDFGLTILKLRRISQGPVSLGDLPTGKWRELTHNEIESLRKDCALL